MQVPDKTENESLIFKMFERAEEQRVCKMLISTLTSSVYCVEKSLFKYRDYPFKQVEILGEVISIQDYRKKKIFEIDDGTGTLRVFTENLSIDPLLKTVLARNGEKPREEVSAVEMAGRITNYHSQKFIKDRVPPINDVELGDLLLIAGKLNEWKGNKRIFCTSFCKINEQAVEYQYRWIRERTTELEGNYFNNYVNVDNFRERRGYAFF